MPIWFTIGNPDTNERTAFNLDLITEVQLRPISMTTQMDGTWQLKIRHIDNYYTTISSAEWPDIVPLIELFDTIIGYLQHASTDPTYIENLATGPDLP